MTLHCLPCDPRSRAAYRSLRAHRVPSLLALEVLHRLDRAGADLERLRSALSLSGMHPAEWTAWLVDTGYAPDPWHESPRALLVRQDQSEALRAEVERRRRNCIVPPAPDSGGVA